MSTKLSEVRMQELRKVLADDFGPDCKVSVVVFNGKSEVVLFLSSLSAEELEAAVAQYRKTT